LLPFLESEDSKLLDVIVGQLAGLYPFFDIFASDISGFKKELLDRTKKPKEKAQVPERNTLNNDVKDIKHDDKDDFNLSDANISKNGYSPANCPTITSNSFSNSNDFRVLLYFFNASKKSSSSEKAKRKSTSSRAQYLE
jgi:hypothetical protein